MMPRKLLNTALMLFTCQITVGVSSTEHPPASRQRSRYSRKHLRSFNRSRFMPMVVFGPRATSSSYSR
ncbi:hypothetical protein FOMG_19900 [Fusarium oxysporum f. sp. melonis 26406]|uniref:Secreted protein n=1 Tax=Fusarium oxysporum f. sp. melonis 26406 TaxID=1089452 RepID=W9YUR8_FUSOX|nr:hypothetical protein FOMG_19900 [Fusarium oxysporum f. sp. melonis 26406]